MIYIAQRKVKTKVGINMPIIWRYLINQFLTTTLLCVCAFVAILLTIRLDEIAHFIALGAPISLIVRFTLYQIPYILPIAIPISCLIGSLILVQRFSSTHELTALRSSGFALRDILAPILLIAILLSLLNFWVISEVATHSHYTTNTLKSELRAINPLLLLNNKHLMRLKGLYFNALGPSRIGESASDVILAIPNNHHERMNLLIAQQFTSSPSEFTGKGVTLISGLNSTEENNGFDHLLVENMGETITSVKDLSQVLQKSVWTLNNDYLSFSLLLTRIEELTNQLVIAKEDKNIDRVKETRAQLTRSLADIARRLSIAFAVFSFTLLGLACGISIGRQKDRKSLFIAIGLTAFYLICFFVAKGLDRNWPLAISLYMLPPAILILTSTILLRRVARGIE